VLAVSGIVCLLGAGWISTDLISSSIKTDGSTWIIFALTGEKTYAAILFTSDRSAINWEVGFSGDIQAQTQIRSLGQIGVHEFSGQAWTNNRPDFTCLVMEGPENKARYDEISTLGLWLEGAYLSSKSISGGKTNSITDIDTAGMVSLSKGRTRSTDPAGTVVCRRADEHLRSGRLWGE
jgi:hypothetical protein